MNAVRIALRALTQFLPALLLLLGSPPVQAKPVADPDRIVVMVSVDGLAAFYMDDPLAEMPTIRALADGGAWARMKASAPTVTWPNHTTLVTGVTPGRHGVVGNNYYDRVRAKPVALILDPQFDKDEIIKVPTIYDAAKAAGLKTAAIRWPASRGAKTLDWTFPEVGSNDMLHKYTTPALLAECQKSGIWADGEAVRSGAGELQLVTDAMCTRVFNHILRTHRPNLALLHIIHVDHTEHVSGPRTSEAYAAIKEADGQVREIWEELKRDFAGKATLLVVSDHGFSPIKRVILPNILLRDAGLVEIKDNKVVGGAAQVIIQGGSAMVYVVDKANPAAVVERVKKTFGALPEIAKIVGPGQMKDHGLAEPKDDPHAPDMILFAKEGSSFAETATGSEGVIDERESKGTHGHDENLPNLHATFIAWGAGIKPGVRPGLISNTQVAPTIAKLLGVSLPSTDGKVLSAALDE